MINEGGDKVDIDYLQARAEKIEPNDIFYKNGDKMTIGSGLANK